MNYRFNAKRIKIYSAAILLLLVSALLWSSWRKSQLLSYHLDHTFQGHHGIVWQVAHAPLKNIFASSGIDNKVKIWSDKSGELIKSIAARNPRSVAFSPDEKFLVIGEFSGNIALWETSNWKKVKKISLPLISTKNMTDFFDRTSSRLYYVSFSPNGQSIIAGGRDILWIIDNKLNKIVTVPIPLSALYRVKFNSDGKYIIVSGNGIAYGKVNNIGDFTTVNSLKHDNPSYDVLINDAENSMIYSQENLIFSSTLSGQKSPEIIGQIDGDILSLTYIDKKTKIIATTANGKIYLLDLRNKEIALLFASDNINSNSAIWTSAASQMNKLIIAGDDAGVIRIWRYIQ